MTGVFLIYQSHQMLIERGFSRRLIVETGTGQMQQFALTLDAYLGVMRFDQRAFLSHRDNHRRGCWANGRWA